MKRTTKRATKKTARAPAKAKAELRKPAAKKRLPPGLPEATILRNALDVHREELATQNEDLRRANALLAAAKERYAQLYDAAPIAYLTLDREGMIVEANLAAGTLIGVPRGRLFGTRFEDVVIPSARASFRHFQTRILTSTLRLTHETSLHAKGGTVPVAIDATPFKDEGDGAAECLLCIADETERLRKETERRTLDQRLAEAHRLESLGRLAGGVAHDFNNLLTITLAHSAVLLLESTEAPELIESIEEIRNASLRAAQLSKQMLAYAGRGRAKLTLLDLHEVLAPMGELFAGATSSGAFVFEPDASPALVLGEAALLRQAVLNVVANAGDAIRPGGQVRLRIDRESTRAAGSESGADHLVIEVSDDGRGMDEATRLRATDPFFSTKQGGRGLGLAVALGNVRAHGGAMTIESEVGRGTTVSMILPASAPSLAAVEGGESSPPVKERDAEATSTAKSSALVLVACASGEDRVRLAELLRRVGYNVSQVEDGKKALSVVAAAPSALAALVVDESAVNVDDALFDTLARIAPELPVVLSRDPARAPTSAHAWNVDGVLERPFRALAIGRVLRAAIGRGLDRSVH